jgi:hypothetical protein
MRKRYYLLTLALAVMPAGCITDDLDVNRPELPIVLLRAFGDTLGWGITDEAVDSIHGFELNIERELAGYFVARTTNVWQKTDQEYGLLELSEGLDMYRKPAMTWYGLVPNDICRRTPRRQTVTGRMSIRVFRYYDKTGATWGGDKSVPWEGRWIGDQSDPLEPYSWPYNCTPNAPRS